jgi:putative ABC transport system ATP-binding protein
MALLAFSEVVKRYPDGVREKAVLNRVSFELDAGETAGVLASRRGGKTTLLALAAGLLVADEGSVCWRGRDLAQMSVDERARARRKDGIGLASSDWRPVASMRVIEHVAVPLYSEGATMSAAEARAWRALENVGAPGLSHLMTDRLTASERLQVDLARALVREPRLLLVDEPAVLPRPTEARALYELLQDLPRQEAAKGRGMALLIASEEITALRGSRVLNLDDGRLHSTDSRRKVLEFPDRRRAGGHGGEPRTL